MHIAVRKLTRSDHDQWKPLWNAYLAFYETRLPDAVYEATWARFHDDAEPMWAYGAFDDGGCMVGIAHIILHRSCWSDAPYCYLQDLFTAPDRRGCGIGRTLIEHVRVIATAKGATRLHWLTHETNAIAMALYDRVASRSGFVQYRIVL
jgi:GNAT superfamily N-acetyltransferase